MKKNQLDERHIPDRLKQLVLRNKLDMIRFSEQAGLAKDTIKKVIYGINSPHIKTLVKIANKYDVSLDWLCSDNKEMKK